MCKMFQKVCGDSKMLWNHNKWQGKQMWLTYHLKQYQSWAISLHAHRQKMFKKQGFDTDSQYWYHLVFQSTAKQDVQWCSSCCWSICFCQLMLTYLHFETQRWWLLRYNVSWITLWIGNKVQCFLALHALLSCCFINCWTY